MGVGEIMSEGATQVEVQEKVLFLPAVKTALVPTGAVK